MTTNSGNIKLSFEDFCKLKGTLSRQLTACLETEAEMNEFDVEEESDLWDGPVVDSKTVVKLSPIVEEITGKKIKPEWIRSGGYNSINEAVTDLINQIELEFRNDNKGIEA